MHTPYHYYKWYDYISSYSTSDLMIVISRNLDSVYIILFFCFPDTVGGRFKLAFIKAAQTMNKSVKHLQKKGKHFHLVVS